MRLTSRGDVILTAYEVRLLIAATASGRTMNSKHVSGLTNPQHKCEAGQEGETRDRLNDLRISPRDLQRDRKHLL